MLLKLAQQWAVKDVYGFTPFRSNGRCQPCLIVCVCEMSVGDYDTLTIRIVSVVDLSASCCSPKTTRKNKCRPYLSKGALCGVFSGG